MNSHEDAEVFAEQSLVLCVAAHRVIVAKAIPAHDEALRPMPDGFGLLTCRLTGGHPQRGISPLQRLHPGHLIRADDPDEVVGQSGRVVVVLADVDDLRLELRVARRIQPGPDQMRLEVARLEEARRMAGRR